MSHMQCRRLFSRGLWRLFCLGALYFNPFLVEEIMNRMMMMMEPDVHEEFSKRAKERYLKVHERQVRDLDGLIRYITS